MRRYEFRWRSSHADRHDDRCQQAVTDAVSTVGGSIVEFFGGTHLTASADDQQSDNGIVVQCNPEDAVQLLVQLAEVSGQAVTMRPPSPSAPDSPSARLVDQVLAGLTDTYQFAANLPVHACSNEVYAVLRILQQRGLAEVAAGRGWRRTAAPTEAKEQAAADHVTGGGAERPRDERTATGLPVA